VIEEGGALRGAGSRFSRHRPSIWDKLRGYKQQVVGKLTGGLAAMARMRKVTVVRGSGRFFDSHHLDVELNRRPRPRRQAGQRQRVRFEQAIIAGRQRSGAARLFAPRTPAVFRFDRGRSRCRGVSAASAGGWGRHHRPGNGDRVRGALGSRVDVVEMTGGLMPGNRSRPGQVCGKSITRGASGR